MHRNYRIAVMESDPLMRELAERWLGEAGHHVVLVTPGRVNAAMALDLIMMDVAHPRLAAERVHSLRNQHQVPILLVSGRLRRSNPSQRLALQLGAAAVLPKPYSQEELLAAVAAALATGT